MLNCLAVGIGGFFGSICRYLIGLIPLKSAGGFPLATLLINIAGAFAIGLFAAVFLKNPALDSRLSLMLRVGLCGGFTTFSTFSLESLNLMKSGSWCMALLYIVLSCSLCVAAAYLGQSIIK